ncbi:MAG TPA: response regulator [Terriglobales bacterium]|jgi:CheY-like chemotaxis protein
MPRTILLADDSPLARRMGTEYLAELGFEVTGAASSAEAWQALEALDAAGQFPELVLAHAALPGETPGGSPGGSGVELARRIKAEPRWRATPVLILVGALATVGAFAPADGVLRKPLSPAGLEPWLVRSPQALLVRAVNQAARQAFR